MIVFVSAAAGAVGSVACQLAKIKGCRVVGSAGGFLKVEYLRELGADAAIDYKAHQGVGPLSRALAQAAPDGIDVYFENVGGDHLAAALHLMNRNGRIAICGMIAGYNDAEPEPGPNNLAMIIQKRLRLQGFLVFDHLDLEDAFRAEMVEWIALGNMKYKETVFEGIVKGTGGVHGALHRRERG